MHGLINRSIQCFLRDTHGQAIWLRTARQAGLRFDSFEPMLHYPPDLTDRLIGISAQVLDRPRDAVLEDLGTYLVSHPDLDRVRRLLRFGGVTFTDFLHSLEDLPDRCRLALPELSLPTIALSEFGEGVFRLYCGRLFAGTGHVMVGLLRAMADDYGALVVVEHGGLTSAMTAPAGAPPNELTGKARTELTGKACTELTGEACAGLDFSKGEARHEEDCCEVVTIRLLDPAFASGRPFALALQA
jgi:hypothetical protein